jgi:FtsH-binding integral membrane protein
MVQLLITVSFIAWFTYHDATKEYVRKHQGIWWGAFAVMIVCLITMDCCGNVRRKAPLNFVFLFLFTIAEGFMLGVAASTYDTDGVCNCSFTLLCLLAYSEKLKNRRI